MRVPEYGNEEELQSKRVGRVLEAMIGDECRRSAQALKFHLMPGSFPEYDRP